MKVLVTGGTGFLGSELVKQLRQAGYEVRVATRREPASLSLPGCEIRQIDFADMASLAAACEDCARVFHVASRVGAWGRQQDFYRDNVLATRHLIDACLRTGVERLVYTSSPSVVIGRQPIRGADESLDYPRRFMSPYQSSKAAAEQWVQAANSSRGLTTTVLRPHAIWGRGDPQLAPRLIHAARRGRLAIIGKGDNRISMVHLRDAAQAHVLAGDAAIAAGKTYFINDPAPVSFWSWVARVLDANGMAAPTRRVPFPLAYGLGAALEWAYRLGRRDGEPPLTRYSAVLLGLDHYFDVGRAQRELGFTSKVSVEDGLQALTGETTVHAGGPNPLAGEV